MKEHQTGYEVPGYRPPPAIRDHEVAGGLQVGGEWCGGVFVGWEGSLEGGTDEGRARARWSSQAACNVSKSNATQRGDGHNLQYRTTTSTVISSQRQTLRSIVGPLERSSSCLVRPLPPPFPGALSLPADSVTPYQGPHLAQTVTDTGCLSS